MPRRSAVPNLFTAILVVLAASVSAATLVLNKCCLQGVNLNFTNAVHVCRDHDRSRVSGEGSPTSPLDVKGHGVPPWLNWTQNIFDADDLKRSTRSLADVLPNTTRVRYGVQPCTTYDHQRVMSLWKNAYSLFTNGSLVLNMTVLGGNGQLMLDPSDYCIDIDEAGRNLALACPCTKVTCFRKCCPTKDDYVFDAEVGLKCNTTKRSSNKEMWGPFRGQEIVDKKPYHLISNKPLQCGASFDQKQLNGIRGQNFSLTVFPDGSALMKAFQAEPFAPGQWCGERIRLENGSLLENAFVCNPRRRGPTSARGAVYATCLLVGACFLALTLGVYAALPELRAPPHAKALMCHCAALLVACLVLAGAHVIFDAEGRFCEVIALIIQFSFLAAFFWLSVLSFDISCAFREIHAPECNPKSASQRTFLCYSIVAWGIPLVITGITAVIIALDRTESRPEWVVPPGIVNECWFEGSAAKWAYYNGVLSALLVANTVMFIMTVARLCGALRNYKELTRGDSCLHGSNMRLNSDKRRFWLHSRLFVLMGLLWAVDAVAPAFDGTSAAADYHYFDGWVLFDIMNMLRGVFLFVVYCCKPKVVRKLRKRAVAWGLPVAGPAAHGAADGESSYVHWPRRWSAWRASSGTVSSAATTATTPGGSRCSSTRSVAPYRSRAASGPERPRLLTLSTQTSSTSRNSPGITPSISPLSITPIPEYSEDSSADCCTVQVPAPNLPAAVSGDSSTGIHATTEAGKQADGEGRRQSWWSRMRLSSIRKDDSRQSS